MLSLVGKRGYYLACFKVDFRKNIDGLLSESYQAGLDPFEGDVVIFLAPHANKIKILLADPTGIWLLSKRFFGKRARFSFQQQKLCRKLSGGEFQIFLEGSTYHIISRAKTWPK